MDSLHVQGQQPQVQVVKLPKSGGVVTRSPEYRKQSRSNRVYEYFYGVRRDLKPHTETVLFSQLQVYQVKGLPVAPISALPIGEGHVLSSPACIMRVSLSMPAAHEPEYHA